MSWERWARERNLEILASGRWRQIRDFEPSGAGGVETVEGVVEGRSVVSFASNDYLGLASHPDTIAAARDAVERWGTGAGSARLIAGSRSLHGELERSLATWKAAERALLFPTGFAANLGVLTALGTGDTLICSDELNHASIVDGCRAAAARVKVYPHSDPDAVDRMLKGESRAIVVTDAVFSMDGDVAPLEDLAEVCRRHGALLVIDEAHSVFGSALDLTGTEVLRVGTLSKFLGSSGGFVAGPGSLIDLLINTARSFIFTTASSPADIGAALAALQILRSNEGGALLDRLRANIDLLRPGHPSPIIPIVVGDEDAAVTATAELLERGFFVPAIRPPSVPRGSSRLRITMSAAHTTEQVEGLVGALDEALGERKSHS
ncbi:MAG: aminotransferase class I/II-fold pyridoxal phosphate-dependent enzyme [Actinobacteria bacterium]|nr:aminotransferase class I/II-fold pyridoxal phosphate-dependent enzyme [Actinomycetota bacterium]